MTAVSVPAYRQQRDNAQLHQICRKCCGIGDAHSLRCPTLQLPGGVPLRDLVSEPRSLLAVTR